MQAVNNAESIKSAIPKKPTHQNTPKRLSKFSSYHRSNLRIVIAVGLCVFLCEAFVMKAIIPLFDLSPWLTTLFDAGILILLISPVLYLFVFRPMAQHIREREQAQQALRESEMRFRTVFHTSPDSITISRLKDGRLVESNEGFTQLTGYSREEALGTSTLDISLWNDPRERTQMVARLQKDGQINNFEAVFKSKGGRLVEGLISARVIMLEEDAHILAISRDISALKQTEKTLRVSRRFLEISNRNREMDSLLKEFIVQVKSLTDSSAVGIRILDENGNIPYQANEGFSPEFYESENPLTIDALRCMCAEVIRGRRKIKQGFLMKSGAFYVGSTSRFMAGLSEAEKDWVCDVCGQYGYESVALIPIFQADKILGLIHLADTRKDQFSLETLEILEGAAMQLGTGIDRVRAEEALKNSHRELEKRVEDRTAKLMRANELLNREIEERIDNEKKMREQQEKLRSLSSELVLTEERERRQIAIELHDRIGQNLAVTKIKLGELRESYPSNPPATQLSQIYEIVDQTIQDTRSLTFEISPPVLYELGLRPALENLIEQFQKQYKIRINFSDDGQSESLDDSSRVIIYRAIRELLFNIVKHACAQSAEVFIRSIDDYIQIGIEDDGVGCDISQVDSRMNKARGYGLFSIRERFNHLGGRVDVQSKPGQGTRVILLLPFTYDEKT